ncbi:unnamed protein product [Camellia sinensis]
MVLKLEYALVEVLQHGRFSDFKTPNAARAAWSLTHAENKASWSLHTEIITPAGHTCGGDPARAALWADSCG